MGEPLRQLGKFLAHCAGQAVTEPVVVLGNERQFLSPLLRVHRERGGERFVRDGEARPVDCIDGWHDPSTDLCWQDPPDETMRSWDGAMACCDGLSLGGSDDWRVPTIDELRSLGRGCPGWATGGACGVAGACLELACWTDLCDGCPYRGGPGSAGAYWPSGLRDTEPRWYWSSSLVADDSRMRWVVGFEGGYVGVHGHTVTGPVRCVRHAS